MSKNKGGYPGKDTMLLIYEKQQDRDECFINASTIDMMKSMIRDGLVDGNNINNLRNKDYAGKYTALLMQCLNRRIDTSRYLLEECNPPADPNLTDIYGYTALHMSVYKANKKYGDSPDIVRLLLDHGADRSIKNKDGLTALDIAKHIKFTQSIELLEKYFPDVEAIKRSRNHHQHLNVVSEDVSGKGGGGERESVIELNVVVEIKEEDKKNAHAIEMDSEEQEKDNSLSIELERIIVNNNAEEREIVEDNRFVSAGCAAHSTINPSFSSLHDNSKYLILMYKFYSAHYDLEEKKKRPVEEHLEYLAGKLCEIEAKLSDVETRASEVESLFTIKHDLINDMEVMRNAKKRTDIAGRRVIRDFIDELDKLHIQPNGDVSPTEDYHQAISPSSHSSTHIPTPPLPPLSPSFFIPNSNHNLVQTLMSANTTSQTTSTYNNDNKNNENVSSTNLLALSSNVKLQILLTTGGGICTGKASSGMSIILDARYKLGGEWPTSPNVKVKLVRRSRNEFADSEYNHLQTLNHSPDSAHHFVACYDKCDSSSYVFVDNSFIMQPDDARCFHLKEFAYAIVMERGIETLDEYIDSNNKRMLDYTDRLQLGKCMASIIEQAHANNIVLMDFKGANVMKFVGRNQDILWKGIDLDSALKVGTPLDAFEGRLAVTKEYLAPELKEGGSSNSWKDKVAMKSMDIWSLGVAILKLFKQDKLDDMFFSCESLSTFTNDKIDGFITKIFDNDPNSHVKNFVLKCLQLEPNDRISSISIKDHFSTVKTSFSLLLGIKNDIAGVSNQVAGVSCQVAGIDSKIDALSKRVADGFMKINGNFNQLLDAVNIGCSKYEDTYDMMKSLSIDTNRMIASISSSPTDIPDLSSLISGFEARFAGMYATQIEALRSDLLTMKQGLREDTKEQNKEVLNQLRRLNVSVEEGAKNAELSLACIADLQRSLITANDKLDALSNMSETLLTDTYNLPTLFIIIPDPDPAGKFDFMNRFIKDRYRLYFVCGYTHQLALSGRDKKGYSFAADKKWVKKIKPLLKLMLVLVKTSLSISFPGIPIPLLIPSVGFKGADGIDVSMASLVNLSEKFIDDMIDGALVNENNRASSKSSSSKGGGECDIGKDLKKVDWSKEGTRELYQMVKEVLDSEEINDPNLEQSGMKFIASGKVGGPNAGKSRWIYDLKAVEDCYHVSSMPTPEVIKAINDQKLVELDKLAKKPLR